MASSFIALALRVYVWVLRLLPSRLMRAHGDELRAAFEERVLASRASSGTLGVVSTTLRACLDVLAHALVSRRSRKAGDAEHVGVLISDLGFGMRSLLRRPGFAAVAAVTLALGVGANAAVFTVVHAVLLSALPFPDSDRIVWIGHHAPGMGIPDLASSMGTYAVYREQARSFAAVAAFRNAQRTVDGGGTPERIDVAVVSPSIFDVLQVRPRLGRQLVEADVVPGAHRVAVLTHVGWIAQFGGSSDVIGRTIELDGVPTEIVGVMPDGFAYPRRSTRALLPTISETPVFGSFGLTTIARLAPGVDLSAARAELDALQPRHAQAYSLPADLFSEWGWSVSVRRLRDVTVGQVALHLWIALATAGFLLIVACASVGNLFLVRGESRRREFAVRRALGAAHGRIALALLGESLWIGLVGGVLGGVLAWGVVRVLVTSGTSHLPRLHEIRLSLSVLALAGVASIAGALLLGLLPMLQQLRAPSFSIARVGRDDVGGRERLRVRRALIVAQIALALVLLTGAGLMLRSFGALRAVDAGLDPEGALVVGIGASAMRDAREGNARNLEMLEAMRALPGVRIVGLTTSLPLGGGSMTAANFRVASGETVQEELPEVLWYEGVSDGYFAAAGTAVIAGRELTPDDIAFGRPVALVNDRFARTVLNGDALGRRIYFGEDSTAYEIVGIAQDVRAFGLREDSRAMAYMPFTAPIWASDVGNVYLVLRSEDTPEAQMRSARAAVRAVDPNAPVLSVRTLQSVLDDGLTDVTFLSAALSGAAVLALLLGAIGLYGMISYAVAERRSEIGVRVALGASPSSVSRLVLRDGLSITVLGTLFGLAGSIVLTRFLRAALFEVSAHDPVTFTAVALVLVAVSLVAAWLPARRAARVDPLEAMRQTG